VDAQERRQLDAAREHVAKVKARARPWRAIVALVFAVIAAAVSVQARIVANLPSEFRSDRLLGSLGRTGNLALAYGAAVVFFLLASVGTIGLGNKARDVLLPKLGYAHAAVVRFTIVVVGLFATILITLQLFDIAVTQLVVGGAVTGVILGIAAQQSLANVFSGIILLSARPFRVGDRIGIRSGALSGLIEGTVTEISLTYVLLETADGPVHVPNSQVLAAAVGPAGAVPSPPGQGKPSAGADASPGDRVASPGGREVPPGGQEAPPGGQEVPPGGQAASPGTGAASPASSAAAALASASAAEAGSSAPPPHPGPPPAQRDGGRQPS
jgi:Mechanosensitive ion channel